MILTIYNYDELFYDELYFARYKIIKKKLSV